MPLTDLFSPEVGNDPTARRIAALFDQSLGTGGGMEDIIKDLGRQLFAAQTDATATQTKLSEAVAAPAPTTDVNIDTILRSLGGAASSLLGTNEPKVTAAKLIEDEQKMLTQKREENLGLLSDAYKRAADRAAKLGDMESEIKFRAQFEKTTQQQTTLRQMLTSAVEGKQADVRQTKALSAERDLRLDLAERESGAQFTLELLRQKGDERTELIRQGLDPDDPTGNTQLTRSKAALTQKAAASGFLTTANYTLRFQQAINSVKTRGMGGFGITYDWKKLATKVIELPPDIAYATNWRAWQAHLLELPNPNDPSRPLFPKDANGAVKEPYKRLLQNYFRKHFPDDFPTIGR